MPKTYNMPPVKALRRATLTLVQRILRLLQRKLLQSLIQQLAQRHLADRA